MMALKETAEKGTEYETGREGNRGYKKLLSPRPEKKTKPAPLQERKKQSHRK